MHKTLPPFCPTLLLHLCSRRRKLNELTTHDSLIKKKNVYLSHSISAVIVHYGISRPGQAEIPIRVVYTKGEAYWLLYQSHWDFTRYPVAAANSRTTILPRQRKLSTPIIPCSRFGRGGWVELMYKTNPWLAQAWVTCTQWPSIRTNGETCRARQVRRDLDSVPCFKTN